MRRLAIPLVLTLALAPAGAAVAKEPVAAKVCGASDCATVEDRSTIMALTEGTSPTDPPAHAGDWYEVTVVIEVDRGRHETFPLAFVPSQRLLRGGDAEAGYTYTTVSDRVARLYHRITEQITPFPPSTLEGIEAGAPAVTPPPPEPAADSDGGPSALPWIVAAAVAALVAVAFAVPRLRRRGQPDGRVAVKQNWMQAK